MASKLFQAIVGVGIAMGGASACMVEHIVQPPEADMDDAGTSPLTPSDASVAVTADGTTVVEQDATAVPSDAQLDPDTLLDAFCDAPWPTTKGSGPLPGCIDPLNQCSDAAAFPCATGADIYTCAHPETSSRCVNGSWQCPAGTRPSSQCVCFAPVPNGFECTDAGLRLKDAAAD